MKPNETHWGSDGTVIGDYEVSLSHVGAHPLDQTRIGHAPPYRDTLSVTAKGVFDQLLPLMHKGMAAGGTKASFGQQGAIEEAANAVGDLMAQTIIALLKPPQSDLELNGGRQPSSVHQPSQGSSSQTVIEQIGLPKQGILSDIYKPLPRPRDVATSGETLQPPPVPPKDPKPTKLEQRARKVWSATADIGEHTIAPFLEQTFQAAGNKFTAMASMVSKAVKSLGSAKTSAGSQTPSSGFINLRDRLGPNPFRKKDTTRTQPLTASINFNPDARRWPGSSTTLELFEVTPNTEPSSVESDREKHSRQDDWTFGEALKVYLGETKLPTDLGKGLPRDGGAPSSVALEVLLDEYVDNRSAPYRLQSTGASSLEDEYATELSGRSFMSNDTAAQALRDLKCDRAIVHVRAQGDDKDKFLTVVRSPQEASMNVWRRGDDGGACIPGPLLTQLNPGQHGVDIYAAWGFTPKRMYLNGSLVSSSNTNLSWYEKRGQMPQPQAIAITPEADPRDTQSNDNNYVSRFYETTRDASGNYSEYESLGPPYGSDTTYTAFSSKGDSESTITIETQFVSNSRSASTIGTKNESNDAEPASPSSTVTPHMASDDDAEVVHAQDEGGDMGLTQRTPVSFPTLETPKTASEGDVVVVSAQDRDGDIELTQGTPVSSSTPETSKTASNDGAEVVNGQDKGSNTELTEGAAVPSPTSETPKTVSEDDVVVVNAQKEERNVAPKQEPSPNPDLTEPKSAAADDESDSDEFYECEDDVSVAQGFEIPDSTYRGLAKVNVAQSDHTVEAAMRAYAEVTHHQPIPDLASMHAVRPLSRDDAVKVLDQSGVSRVVIATNSVGGQSMALTLVRNTGATREEDRRWVRCDTCQPVSDVRTLFAGLPSDDTVVLHSREDLSRTPEPQ
jgi:hypothetical protein